jgi:uncharacterized protein YaiI (UPF0178 family)
MAVWVDADACPKVIKEIIYRAAIRTKIIMTFVANQPLFTPVSPFIKKVQVQSGLDVADHYIIQHTQKGDLVITADIPLADAVVAKGCKALNPRGQFYSEHNIKQHLAYRNLNQELRSSGIISGGPGTLSKREAENFANAFNKYLTRP